MLLALVGVYLLLLVGLSKLMSRRMGNLSDFFLAGRSLPGMAIAITFVASWFGAGSTIGSINQAYEKGLSALWLIAVPSLICCLMVGFLWAGKIRRLESLSLPEAVERQYGPLGAFLMAWIILACVTTYIASQLVAAGHLFEIAAGWSPTWSILFILGAVILYSWIGGFRAVVMTDIVQFICFSLALVILMAYVLLMPPTVPYPMEMRVGFWDLWLDLPQNLAMLFTFVLAWSIAPEMWQRMSSTRSPRQAKMAALTAGGLLGLLYAMVMIVGLVAVYHLPSSNAFAQKNVLVSLSMLLPSPVLTAAVLVGVLSAITSSVDSSLNVGSLTFSRDIVNRHLWPKAKPEHLVLLSRAATVLLGIPAVVAALFYQDLIQILWISADIYASTMFIPVMGLFYSPNSGRLAGIYAILFGSIPVILNFLKDLHLIGLPDWYPKWPFTTLMGIGLSLVGFCVGILYHRLTVQSKQT